ncbi:MAG: choice-of-anchor D domain-containing protein [Ignavibacteria bacterium]|nr:choice-of-anchor D domain-containing protein [Ignavibacteria bacterium]
MKKMIHSKAGILVLTFLATSAALFAQKKIPTAEEMLSVNGAQGREFFIAIPPNEILPYPTQGLELYIASAFDTEVEVTDYAGNRKYKRKITAGDIRTLSDTKGETNWTWEVREYDRVTKKAIRLKADKPISVYVLNSKVFSSDGYLAIPTAAWGNEYIVTSYYDFREFSNWASGWVVIAREDNTVLDILLRGTGELDADAEGGKKLNTGQPYQISMEEGDVYYMKGTGQTRGIWDMSGTLIRSSKPIGLISSHERTTMPNLLQNGNGRNHLVEMTPPTTTWGKKYVTVEYSRENKNSVGRGDVFRVFALRDQTRFTLKYYDKVTKALVGQGGGYLAKGGDFFDLVQAAEPTTITYGFSVWEADKPIFVMQYSNSSSWDGDPVLDPFMINVVPEEQFITSTIFQQPTISVFQKHRLNLIVWADSSDPNYIENLKSLEIDSVPVWRHPQAILPSLLFNRMPRMNLHWTTVDFGTSAKSHRISSNGKIKFGGYIYGFGNFDAYGWPAASGFRPVGVLDTMPPLLKADSLCGDFTYRATELRNIPDPPVPEPIDTDQVETGVAVIDTVPGSNSYNYRLVLITSQDMPRDPSWKVFDFRWEVIDKSKDAYAEFFVQDWADNFTYDTIRYFADKLLFTPNPLKFGKIRLGTNKQLDLTVKNISDGSVKLTEALLEVGTYFMIAEFPIPPAVTLQPGASWTFKIVYDGRRETSDVTKDFDLDSLVIKTTCGQFKIGLEGVAAIPRIRVADFNAGTVGIGEERCKTGGLRIQNPGSDTLIVSSMTGYAGQNFTVSSPTIPRIPFTIPPKGEVFLEKICYERSSVGSDSIDVTFGNNGDGPDSISTWVGKTEAPGPGIEGYNWLKRRVNTRHQAFARVYNSGNQVLRLTDVTFADGSKYFPTGSTDATFVFKIGSIFSGGTPVTSIDLSNGQSVDVLVEFRPAAVQVYSEKIIPVWATPGIDPREAFLEGEGIVPLIETQGASLNCNESPEYTAATRDLVITNNGSMDLTITRLAFATGSDPAWQFGTPAPTTPFIVPFAAGINVMRIPIVYTRPVGYIGGSALTVEIDHDATPGTGIDSVSYPPMSATERFIVGSCAGPDISVTNIDFGRLRANCDDRQLDFTILNTGGGSKDLVISNIIPTGPDASAFQVINIIGPVGTPVTLPFTIPSSASATVTVRFTPTEPNAAPWVDRVYNAQFRIMNYEEGDSVNEIRPDTYANVTGVGYVIPVTMRLTNSSAGVISVADDDLTFTVSGESQDWVNARLTDFTADVVYETLALGYLDKSVGTTALTGGWTISNAVIVSVDNTFSIMRFNASGPTAIAGDGPLFTFRAKLLLGPNFKTDQKLNVDLKQACLIPTTSGSSTEIINCALTRRVVSLSLTKFSMSPIWPNPTSSGKARFDFGIGINAPVYIDVVSAQGQVVATMVNSVLEAGEYSLEFPTNLFGNGLYFVRLKSADFSKTQQLIVND